MIRGVIIVVLTLGAVGMGLVAGMGTLGVSRQSIALHVTADPPPIMGTTIRLRTGPVQKVLFIEKPSKWPRLSRLVGLSVGRGGETIIYIASIRLPPLALSGLLATYPTIAFVRGPVRRRRRRRRGLCIRCGYNLTGNVSGVCPECGTEIEQP